MNRLVGKSITPESLAELAHYCKGDFSGYDKSTDEVSIELDDTNLPYLWSVEGIARLLRGVLRIQKGIPKIKIINGNYEVRVDKTAVGVRPYIAAFVAKGRKIDDTLLKQLVQLQEKFCDGYGRKRQKASIGLYSYKRIKFPVHYKAVEPSSASFVPLGMQKKLSLAQILEEHPKGREYKWILDGLKKYPLLVDDKGDVLSFPPIINSDFIGKLETGDSDIFFEITGTDEQAIMLATNIFAYALSERGFELFSVKISYPERNVSSPSPATKKIRISRKDVEGLLGLKLKEPEIRELAERAGFGFNNYTITIPPYREDIMHPFDVIEDIAIIYGFGNILPQELESYTIGQKLPIVDFIDRIRELAIGIGYQEVMSPILSNKNTLYTKMNSPDTGTVEIENPMSELFSAIRSWLSPILLEMLSKNKHVDFPQKVFEQGLVTVRSGNKISDYEKMALMSSHSTADYTESKQAVELLMRQLGIKYSITEKEHKSFIKGRSASLIVAGREVGIFGEINPAVLSNWGIEMPVSAVEINISDLYETDEKAGKRQKM
ncbi:phenylalanine--tRNA ligase subunit beta [Candidatus Woesearchaeota archaeon]|nr:phenylalanine--tRNA ligase subunit beta [Candidatus Woesearchaeota archaeon]